MIITNINDQFIKVKSDYISSLFQDSPPYQTVEIDLNLNCCGIDDEQSISSTLLDPSTTNWNFNLDTATKLNYLLNSISYKNMITGIVSKIDLTSAIDLGYVDDNCSVNNCTLETFTSHFVPLFKTAIDDFFDDLGISSNVVVTFDENTLRIADVPTPYIIDHVEYGVENTPVFGTYGDTESIAFLVDDSLFITPAILKRKCLVDGIYNIQLKYNDASNGFVIESNCAFVDIKTKCKVASTLQNLISEREGDNNEVVSMLVHTLHYALVNGSNCGCNCDEMCEVYAELYKLLNENPEIINTNCGC
jgi:hypothetical protein